MMYYFKLLHLDMNYYFVSTFRLFCTHLRYHRNLVDKTPPPQEGVKNGGLGHGRRNLGRQPAVRGMMARMTNGRGMIMFRGNPNS
jgi:hypothetical protein